MTLAARELVSGDVIRLRSGDFVPADAQIIDGTLQVDQSALTGESLELDRTADDRLYSGSIVKQGEANAVVAATGSRTCYGRTTELVQSAHPKLHIEPVISRIVRWLFVIVGAQVAIACVLALAKGIPLIEILPLTLVLLMSAIPVALPVMFTVSMALGAIELGRHGVLVTRLSAAEDAANLDVLCADKTGTLTMNRLALPSPGQMTRGRCGSLALPCSQTPCARIPQALVAELRALGVAVKMLTGDALAVANDTARALGIGRIVRASELRAADAASKAESLGLTLESGGYAEVYPEDKFSPA